MRIRAKLLTIAVLALVVLGMPVAGTAFGAVSSLRIDGISSFYDVPYLLDFNFSLRDQNNHAAAVSSGSGESPMGTPIDWLNQYGFTSGYAHAELDDQDGDGMATWQEYIAGTIPTNGQSVFRFEDIMVEAAGCQLVMSTESNRVYRVDWSDDLKTWQALATDLKGDGQPKVITDVGASGHG